MQNYPFFAAVLILVCQSSQAAPEISAQDAPVLGEIYQFSTTDTEIGLINNTDHPITITGIIDASNNLRLKHSVEITPRHVQSVPIQVNAMNRLGLAHIDGTLTTEPPLTDPVDVAVNAFVNSILEDGRPLVDFGVVESGVAKTQIFRPVSEQPEPLRIVTIKSIGDGFMAKIIEDGKALSITVQPNARWGSHFEFAKVLTNSTLQKELWIRLKANVHGAVVASVDPVDFSVVRQGSGAEEAVLLEGKSSEAFKVESVHIEGAKLSYVVEPCAQREGCASLKFRLDDAQPTGQLFGTAQIKFKNTKNVLPINVRGLVIGKDVRIIELPPKQTSSADDDANGVVKSNLVDEIKAATSEPAAPPPPPSIPAGKGPLLKWSVTHEEGDLHGYVVYRSTEESGPFVRVNDAIIVKPEGSKAGDFAWRDNSAESGKTYWYYVGLVYNDGHKSKLTGPQKVVAK